MEMVFTQTCLAFPGSEIALREHSHIRHKPSWQVPRVAVSERNYAKLTRTLEPQFLRYPKERIPAAANFWILSAMTGSFKASCAACKPRLVKILTCKVLLGKKNLRIGLKIPQHIGNNGILQDLLNFWVLISINTKSELQSRLQKFWSELESAYTETSVQPS